MKMTRLQKYDILVEKVIDQVRKELGCCPFNRSDFVNATSEVYLKLYRGAPYPSDDKIPILVDEVVGLLSDAMGDY